MGEVLPRNVIVSMILLFFVITTGIFIITGTYTGLGIATPDAVDSVTGNISGTKTDIELFADTTKDVYLGEAKEGFVTKACTTLLGSDNFFCAGIQTLGQFTKTPEKIELTVNAFNKSFPVEIPQWIISTLVSILVIILVFVGISAYRRYKS